MSGNSIPASEIREGTRSRILSRVLSCVVASIGVVVLVGWAVNLLLSKSVFPSLVLMKVNTAIGLMLFGASLALLSRKRVGNRERNLAAVLSLIATSVGALTLVEYFLGLDFRIDNSLFPDLAVEASNAGRMSPATALCFVFIGAALLLVSKRRAVRLREPVVAALSAAVVGIGGLALGGYLVEALLRYRLWNYTGTAVHTAVGVALMGCALLAFVRSKGGLTWMLDRTSTAVFLGAIVLTIAAFGSAFNLAKRLQLTEEWVSHTQEVLKASQELQTNVANLESSQRGYIVTADGRPFDRFGLAKERIPVVFADIRTLTSDNPHQQGLLDQLEPMIARQIYLADQTVTARNQPGFAVDQQLIAAGIGSEITDNINLILERMQDEEHTLLESRKDQSEAASVTTFLSLPVGLFLSLTSLSLGVFLLNAGIGAQIRANQAASDSEGRMAGIVNSAMDAIISVDSDQKIVLFNTAAEKIFRCAATAVMGQPIDMFVPKPSREGHHRHVEGFGRTGVTSRSMRSLGTLRGLRADGDEFPIEASISQIESGGQTFYTVILRDITERNKAEEELRASEAKLQTIVENLTEGLAVSNLDGQLLHFNRAALKIHGFAKPEEGRRHLTEFADIFELAGLDGEVLPIEQWPLARILRGENVRDLELRIRRLEDDWQRVFNYGGMLVHGPDGQALLGVVTISDITERKLGEQEVRQLNDELEQRVLKRTAELESANKELEAFSYSVSHDLRAPLRAVDGFSQAVIEDYGQQLPEEGKRYLRTIRESAQRMGDLIDDLLIFSRLSRQTLKKRVVKTDELVRNVRDEMSSGLGGRQVEVRIGALPVCYGDPSLLNQVWINLLSNALKFSGKREAAVVEIGSVQEKGEDIFFVRDNGTGFDMKYADKLFGVFQRLHRAEEFEGTGVGLSIVQRIVHRHGGRVWADAAEGRGATFYFTLTGETNNHE